MSILKENKLIIFTSLVILVLFSGAIVYGLNSQKKDSETKIYQPETQEAGLYMGQRNSGRIINYNEFKLIDNQEYINVYVFLPSSCNQCVEFVDNLRSQEANLPEDVNLVLVDIEQTENTQVLAQKFAVESEITFVKVNSLEEEVKKWTGSKNVSDVLLAISS